MRLARLIWYFRKLSVNINKKLTQIAVLSSDSKRQEREVEMAKKHNVEGYDNFKQFIDNLEKEGKDIFIYFSGTKDPKTGESWCDDCVRAWPEINKAYKKLPKTAHFVIVEVGTRPVYKDPKCPFRTDPKIKIMQLPTIVKWNTPKVLVGDQCEKPDLLDLLFTEED